MTPGIVTDLAVPMVLIPLAIGCNIYFVKMFTELNPHIFVGGVTGAFWVPLSWTMVFGLIFGTFITLILVPVLYYIVYKVKVKTRKKIQKLQIRSEEHTSELQSLMRISYAVFCLKKKTIQTKKHNKKLQHTS